jgi:hypothetical protein
MVVKYKGIPAKIRTKIINKCKYLDMFAVFDLF